METIGLTDIIGPVMVGPSSSHTSFALVALCGRFRFRTLYRLAAGARSRLRTVNGSNM